MIARDPGSEQGIALVAVMVASTVLLTLALSLALTTTVEVGIAANHRDGVQTLLAADAAIEQAIADLAVAPDWNAVLAGAVTSPFHDGARAAALPDGARLNVAEETNRLRCGVPDVCGDASIDQSTGIRPYGRNNPRWTVFASGRLAALIPDAVPSSRAYVVVWVGDDPSENDGQPLRDGEAPAVADPRNLENPGRGALWLHAQAYGASGARRVVEAVVERDVRLPPNRLRVRVWREIM